MRNQKTKTSLSTARIILLVGLAALIATPFMVALEAQLAAHSFKMTTASIEAIRLCIIGAIQLMLLQLPLFKAKN